MWSIVINVMSAVARAVCHREETEGKLQYTDDWASFLLNIIRSQECSPESLADLLFK